MNRKPTLVLLIVISMGLVGTGCNSGASSAQAYEEAKLSVEDTEMLNPTSFLSVEGTYRSNLIGEFVVEGTITNSATIATYQDAVLEISFYSKTGTLLGTEKKALYEYFPAGQIKTFKIKTYGYEGTHSIGLGLHSASASYQ